MKRNLIAVAVAIGSVVSASAGMISYSSGTLNASIPDTPSLYSSSITVSGNPNLIDSLSVTLNFSGGYNADLYGYLVYNDQTVVLLNRIGITGSNPYGAAGAGMNITLSDGSPDIHSAGLNSGILSGSWAPDGRVISPLSSGVQFDSAPRQNGGNPLATFNNLNPNGTWTLYFSDLSSGQQGALASWGLNLSGTTPVPEPITWALVIFGGVFGGVQAARRFAARKSE